MHYPERCGAQLPGGYAYCERPLGHTGEHRGFNEVKWDEPVPINNDAPPAPRSVFSEDDSERQKYPIAEGCLFYFPAALAYVSMISKRGNDKHNPGEPMHWARGKSTDHDNKIVRHLVDARTTGKDKDGIRHRGYLAWRALASLQEELEREEGAPRAPNAY